MRTYDIKIQPGALLVDRRAPERMYRLVSRDGARVLVAPMQPDGRTPTPMAPPRWLGLNRLRLD